MRFRLLKVSYHYHLRVQRGNYVQSRLSVCLSVLFGSNCECLDLHTILGRQVYVHNTQIKVEYQRHKVEVTQAQLNTHTWVVCLRRKGNLVLSYFIEYYRNFIFKEVLLSRV